VVSTYSGWTSVFMSKLLYLSLHEPLTEGSTERTVPQLD
jgi:hypothetical protein